MEINDTWKDNECLTDELQKAIEEGYRELERRHEEEKRFLIPMADVRDLIEKVIKMKPFAVAGYPDSYCEYNLGWQGAAEMLDSMLVVDVATGRLRGLKDEPLGENEQGRKD